MTPLDSLARDLALIKLDDEVLLERILEIIRRIEGCQCADSALEQFRSALLIQAKEILNGAAFDGDALAERDSSDFEVFEITLDTLEDSSDNDSLASDILDSTLVDELPHASVDLVLPPIPMVLNHRVEKAICFFQTRGKKVMQRWLDRSAIAIPELSQYIREAGFPDEIIYLSMIESGFNYHAYSRAKAVGPWQFITGTARRYGLKVNRWYDERRDPELSTRAAMAYLRDLYGMFGDWYLAMAAYNCGERKIEKLVRLYGSDFWDLKKLRRETEDYVPTYIAARMIAESPEIYGFWRPTPLDIEPSDVALITECIALKDLAECAGITVDALKTLNPAMLRTTTPPGGDSIWVRLPAGTLAGDFWEKYAEIPTSKKKVVFTTHTIRRGETLGEIAGRYGVTIADIVNHPDNHIGRRYTIWEGQVLSIGILAGEVPSNSAKATEYPTEPGVHIVSSGETLASIARKYSSTPEILAAVNGLQLSDKIHLGQKIRISNLQVNGKRTSSDTPRDGEHLVVSGDTLWHIARRYGITVESLRRANGLHARSKLIPGQRLSIPIQN